MIQFRTATRAALATALAEFKTANSTPPGKLRQVHRARPAAFGALPCIYIAGMTDTRIQHTAGLRQRDVQTTLVLVDEISDNEEVVARLDALADALIDFLSARPHILGDDTIAAPTRGEQTELDLSGVRYAAVVVTLLGQVQEGRQ